jgi:hypothetical protein
MEDMTSGEPHPHMVVVADDRYFFRVAFVLGSVLVVSATGRGESCKFGRGCGVASEYICHEATPITDPRGVDPVFVDTKGLGDVVE